MQQFSQQLLEWFRDNGRHDLPWQERPPNPYRIWISEIMLQQTQVKTVIPYYQRFIARFPEIASLAKAELDEVLQLWSGLGYYMRGRNLHRAAKIVQEQYGGRFPNEFTHLCALPGIGETTAAAIMSLAYNCRHPILDGNVKRVLVRYYALEGWPGEATIQKQLWRLADRLMPIDDVADYTQAIMDLGATICRRSQPQCMLCPVVAGCLTKQRGKQSLIPAKKPRKVLELRKTVFLMIQKEPSELLLEQRPPVGVWPGLWGFPECGREENTATWVERRLGYSVTSVQTRPLIKHSFTHFKLEILPAHIKVLASNRVLESGKFRWHKLLDELSFGTPAPVKKLLLELNA